MRVGEQMDAKRELTSIDLFAGAGGLTEGLRQAGFKSLYANELVPTYAATFSSNHPNTLVDSDDIRLVDAAEVRERLGLSRGDLTLIAGGPPCQGFSINAPKRSLDDSRNHLFRDFLRFVEEFAPKAVLIENVPGLLSFEGGATLRAILNSLIELEYTPDVRVLYAPHYGVPQTRWRTIILAVKGKGNEPHFPTPEFMAPARANFTSKFDGQSVIQKPLDMNLKPYVSVSDALSDLPVLSNGEVGSVLKPYRSEPQNWYQEYLRNDSATVSLHQANRLGQKNVERLSYIQQGGNWTDIPHLLLPAGMQKARKTDHTKRYGRVSAQGLASTILTKCDPHWGAYFHYDQDRVFTVREAARIQSFPDRYQFGGNRSDQFEQVGNAVPPLLGRAVGKALIETLDATYSAGIKEMAGV